jgi:uncharacterized membrane protein (DUF373 family)
MSQTPETKKERRPSGWGLEYAMSLIEWAVAVILLFLAAWGVAGLVYIMVMAGSKSPFELKGELYIQIIDAVLVVFIVVELFRIAVAYIRHHDVVSTVMEAALVAVARKVLIIEPSMDAQQLLYKSVGLGVLMLSIGIVWYMLRRSGVGFEEREADYLLPRLFGRRRALDSTPGVAPDPTCDPAE